MPKKLNRVNFEQSVHYLQTYGRPLEQQLFQHEFYGASPQPALEALQAFQNPDGGYGRALEPDIRAQVSSAIATSQALGLLHRLDAPAQSAQVQGAIAYLLRHFDVERLVWPIVPLEIEAAPHAPWWAVASSAETFNGFKFNPRAEIVAHLTHYRVQVPQEFLTRVTGAMLDDIDLNSQVISKNSFLCLRELAETDGLPAGWQPRLQDWLTGLLPSLVLKGPARWTDYGLPPLEAAPRPDTPWSQALDPAELQANLDELIERQLDDGSWPLTWSWDFVDAQAWVQAERDWKGLLIFNYLSSLKAYDRLGSSDYERR